MRCENCEKGRPRLFAEGKAFCNEDCYKTWKDKEKKKDWAWRQFEEGE
jgi:hypothetical protein